MKYQERFKESKLKGVTPVVAIVLLLLVTVGAVGIVYTQFQGIVDNSNTNTEFLESVNVKLLTPQRKGSNPGNIQISLENTGQEQYNLSDIARLEYSIPGESRIRPTGSSLFGGKLSYDDGDGEDDCFNGFESFSPNDDPGTCDTGVEFPSPSQEVTIYLVQEGKESNAVIDQVNCSPSTSTSTTC